MRHFSSFLRGQETWMEKWAYLYHERFKTRSTELLSKEVTFFFCIQLSLSFDRPYCIFYKWRVKIDPLVFYSCFIIYWKIGIKYVWLRGLADGNEVFFLSLNRIFKFISNSYNLFRSRLSESHEMQVQEYS